MWSDRKVAALPLFPLLRRSTIEVHPNFSEAPHSRSSIPHAKTNLNENQNASRRIIPWPKSSKRFFFSEIKIDIPTICSQGTPSFGNKIAEMCYLYRRTGLLYIYTVYFFTPFIVSPLLSSAPSLIWGTIVNRTK